MIKKYNSQSDFFDVLGDEYVQIKKYKGFNCAVTIEEMYHHFKERLIKEGFILERLGKALPPKDLSDD